VNNLENTEQNKKRFNDWLFLTSSNLASGLILLLVGAILAKPAYDHLLNVVAQKNQQQVTVDKSPSANITVNQTFNAISELTSEETLRELPLPYQQPLQNLRRASEDVVAVFKDTAVLDKPVSEFKNIADGDTHYNVAAVDDI
jgi:hypothetical protein